MTRRTHRRRRLSAVGILSCLRRRGPVQAKARKERAFDIPLHLASSSARGLVDLYFYLRHVAKPFDLLLVDEPGSHLDTKNQILLARTLARMMGAGVRVLITTHSDYLIKEINNLIMLSELPRAKSKEFSRSGYTRDDVVNWRSVRAYIAEENRLTECRSTDSVSICPYSTRPQIA